MSMTRAEMYQTVRKALSVGDGVAFMQLRMDAWGALDALEADEREAPKCATCNGTRIERSGVCYCGESMDGHSVYDNHSPTEMERPCQDCATRPAPRAAEAIVTAFARDFFVRHDHSYSGVEIYEWLKKKATGPAAPPAALAAPCECQRLREKLAKWKKDWREESAARLATEDQLSDARRELAELADAKSEIVRLTAERDEAIKFSRILEENRAHLERHCVKLLTELRQAVDALRPFEEYYRNRNRYPTDAEYMIVAGFVAAYDAKHGEVKPDAPGRDYSECPNCHVTLYRSAADTHERRHEIRDGGEVPRG